MLAGTTVIPVDPDTITARAEAIFHNLTVDRPEDYRGELPDAFGSTNGLWLLAYALAPFFDRLPDIALLNFPGNVWLIQVSLDHIHPELGPGDLMIGLRLAELDGLSVAVFVEFAKESGPGEREMGTRDHTRADASSPLGVTIYSRKPRPYPQIFPADRSGDGLAHIRRAAEAFAARLMSHYGLDPVP